MQPWVRRGCVFLVPAAYKPATTFSLQASSHVHVSHPCRVSFSMQHAESGSELQCCCKVPEDSRPRKLVNMQSEDIQPIGNSLYRTVCCRSYSTCYMLQQQHIRTLTTRVLSQIRSPNASTVSEPYLQDKATSCPSSWNVLQARQLTALRYYNRSTCTAHTPPARNTDSLSPIPTTLAQEERATRPS